MEDSSLAHHDNIRPLHWQAGEIKGCISLHEILEERCGRAKSGLMLAPAKTQALPISEPEIIKCLETPPN
jgi:hypothetical protein